MLKMLRTFPHQEHKVTISQEGNNDTSAGSRTKREETTKTGLNKEWILVLSLKVSLFFLKPSKNFKSIVQDIVTGRKISFV